MSMVKYKNFDGYTENGVRYIRYDRLDHNGEWTTVEEPFYLKNGDVNMELVNLLEKFNKEIDKDIAKSKLEENKKKIADEYKKKDEQLSTYVSKNEVDQVSETKNTNWFKRHKKIVITGCSVILGAAIGLGAAGLVFHKNSKRNSSNNSITTSQSSSSSSTNKENIDEPVYGDVSIDEAPIDISSFSTTIDESSVVGAVGRISYNQAIKAMSGIGKTWKDLGYKDVSQRSLNSLYFITNYDLFDKNTVKQLVNNHVVSDDPMVIISDSLEALSVCNDQGNKKITGQNAHLIDMTMFCTRKEDKSLVTHAFNTLKMMGPEAHDKNVITHFESYYYYLNNEESTKFPIKYNEADKGVNYLLNQAYGPIFTNAAGQHGEKNYKLNYVEEHTGMNDFSSVIKEMEKCLSNTNSLNESYKKTVR